MDPDESQGTAGDAGVELEDGGQGRPWAPDATPSEENDASSEAGFSVMSAPRLLVQSGRSAVLRVDLTRDVGFTGALEVSLDALPEGVTSLSRVVTQDESSVQLVVNAAANLAPGTRIDARLTARSGVHSSQRNVLLMISGSYFSADPTFPIDPVPPGKVVVLDDGSFVVLSLAPQGPSSTTQVLQISRFSEDGARDGSFGSNGTGTVSPYEAGRLIDVRRTPEGLYVATGPAQCAPNTGCPMRISRHRSADGELDVTFGTAGSILVPLAHTVRLVGASILPDSEAGVAVMFHADDSLDFTNNWFGLMRWTARGAPRAGFGEDGFMRWSAPADWRDHVFPVFAHLPDGAFALGVQLFDLQNLGDDENVKHGYLLGRVERGSSEMTFLTHSTQTLMTEANVLTPWNTILVIHNAGIFDSGGGDWNNVNMFANEYDLRSLQRQFSNGPYLPEGRNTALDVDSVGEITLAFDAADRPLMVGHRGQKYVVVRYTRALLRDVDLDDDGMLELDAAIGRPTDFTPDAWGALMARSDKLPKGLVRFWP